MSKYAILVLGAALASKCALAGHTLTFVNNCKVDVRPKVKAGNEVPVAGDWVKPGGTFRTTIPDHWEAGKFWVSSDKCADFQNNDGAGCTVGECTIGGDHPQCNLSAVAGFSDPAALTFGSQTRTCKSKGDPYCYDYGQHCGARDNKDKMDCLMRDKSADAALKITLCPGDDVVSNGLNPAAKAKRRAFPAERRDEHPRQPRHAFH